MAEHQGTKTLAEIYILASVNGRHGSALRATKEDRRTPNAFEGAYRTVHAAGRDAERTLKVFA